MASEFVDIDWAGCSVRIEHQWITGHELAQEDAPLIVFLHEGLGSVTMWRDFPQQLCTATGCRGLVYSRPGYGQSTPRAAGETWGLDFMHRQAHEVLPTLLAALGITTTSDKSQKDKPQKNKLWLLGHSDGGSIALLYAARFPGTLGGVIVLAPHIKVEAVSVESIAKAKIAYEQTDLRARLARYHNDPDSAFWGWATAWLDTPFLNWSIEHELSPINCPLLAIQGLDDEYGTLEQVQGIARHVPQTRLLELPNCGHSPHRDQMAQVIAAAMDSIRPCSNS